FLGPTWFCTLSLHDALPISRGDRDGRGRRAGVGLGDRRRAAVRRLHGRVRDSPQDRVGRPDRAGGRVHRAALRRGRPWARVGPRRSLSVEAIEHPPIFRLPGIPDHVTYTWLVMVILAGVAFAASRNVRLVPRGLQN